MKNETNYAIFLSAFSSRIEAAFAISSALTPSSDELQRLKEASSDLDAAVSGLGQGHVEDE